METSSSAELDGRKPAKHRKQFPSKFAMYSFDDTIGTKFGGIDVSQQTQSARM